MEEILRITARMDPEQAMAEIEKGLTPDKKSKLAAALDGMKKTGQIVGYDLSALGSSVQSTALRVLLIRNRCYKIAIADAKELMECLKG